MIAVLLAALALQPCTVDDLAARCGTLRVPENRAVRGGRTIDLNIAVVPAKTRRPDAIFVLAGGPGVAATNLAGFASESFAGSGRDIVLVDIRGAGRSNGLRCELPHFTDMLPPRYITSCRDELSKRADLTQYTTARVVEDLEEARRALGYAKVDLYGTSYGTRVAIEYMRRHPARVRAAILDGVVPPSFALPSTFAREAQRSLERVFELCLADEACRAAYPDSRADYHAVLAAVEHGIDITVEEKTVRVERGLFGEILRNFLYSPAVYRQLPRALHLAARGDWSAFAGMAQRYMRGIRTVDLGLFLSVTCAEDIPRLDAAAARREAAGTFLGTYRIDQQVEACRIWPRGAADPSLSRPLAVRVPTLIISGELDPATPARFGDELARTLPRSLHIVIPYGSHSGETGGCQEKVFAELMREGSAAHLDRACFDALKPPSFTN